jgi:Leucine-rich repeat (LRR) protein
VELIGVTLSKVVGTTASALARRLLQPPRQGAGLVGRPVRLQHWVSWRGGPRQLAQSDVEKLVRELVLRAGDADSSVRLLGPTEGELVVSTLTATLMALDTISMDTVQDAEVAADRLAAMLLSALPEGTAALAGPAAGIYRALLDVCCVQIIEFFTKQPGFSIRTAAEQSRRLGEMLERTPDPSETARQFEQRFREVLATRLDKAHLFGLQLPPEEQTYQLSTAYVGLTMQPAADVEPGSDGGASPGPAATPGSGQRSESAVGPVRVEYSLSGRKRWLIEGPAGAGKSTLLRRLAVHVARGDLPDQLAAWRDTVPFLLRLRTFMDGESIKLPVPEDFVAAEVPPLAGEKPTGWVSEILLSGRGLVFVDGVDEVPERHRGEVMAWLHTLTDCYQDSWYIITSRAPAMRRGWRTGLRRRGFGIAALEPMTRGQVADFVDRWHQAAGADDADPDLSKNSAATLKKALVARRDLARLATNPLLCAMICALNRNGNNSLPQGRISLYDDALVMMLERREREERIRTLPIELTRNHLEPMLSRLAVWMTLNGRRTISREAALRTLEDPLRRVHLREASLSAEDALDYLVERSGLLQEPTLGLLEFCHPSFQDYLAAVEIFDQDHLDHLFHNVHDPLYHDVVIMAVGQTQKDPARQHELLTRLVDRATRDEEHGRRLWLLAAACIADVNMVDPDVAARIQRETSRLLPPTSLAEADSVAGAGEFVLDLLAEAALRPGLTDQAAAATVRVAGLVGGDPALPLLRHMSQRRSTAVQRELLAAWFRSPEPMRYAQEVLADACLDGTCVDMVDLDYLPLLATLGHLCDIGLPVGTDSADVSRLTALDAVQGRIRTLRLGGTRVGDLCPLARLAAVEGLDLSGTPVADIAPLAGLSQLTRLDLSGTSVADIAPLAGLSQLARLDLSGTSVADIAPLAGLSQLTTLDLSGTSVTGVASLTGLTGLRQLGLLRTPVTDIRPLSSLTGLQTLVLLGTRVVDLASLAGLTELRQLDLSGTSVVDGRPLAGLRNLATLVLFGTRVVDLTPLAGLTELRQLDLSGTSVVDLSPLAELPQLETLDLSGTSVVDLRPLAGLTELRHLDLSGTPVDDVAPLGGLLNLQAVDLSGTSVTNGVHAALRRPGLAVTSHPVLDSRRHRVRRGYQPWVDRAFHYRRA